MLAPIESVSSEHFTIPTDRPEADGTLSWSQTTLVVVFVKAGGNSGLGYTYSSSADVELINTLFAEVLVGKNSLDIPACWHAMRSACRNLGLRGLVASAIGAIDVALWDLKARLLDIPLATLMGRMREAVPVYGSGGFTTYGREAIHAQIQRWREQGIDSIKIKVGTTRDGDVDRVSWAREALGDRGALMVDANGAYTTKRALDLASAMAECGVCWFEEPVSSDQLENLQLIRANTPPGMDISAGEYGYDMFYFRRMLDAGAVDVLQIDATRAQGYTGFLHAASVAQASGIPISSHCAPALHLPVCCCAPELLHMEYFHDHVRIEQQLFDGVPVVTDGKLAPTSAAGNGLTFRRRDACRMAA